MASARLNQRWWANRLESPNSQFAGRYSSSSIGQAPPSGSATFPVAEQNSIGFFFQVIFPSRLARLSWVFCHGTEGAAHFLTLRLPNLASLTPQPQLLIPTMGLSRKEAASWQRSAAPWQRSAASWQRSAPSYDSISHNETGL